MKFLCVEDFDELKGTFGLEVFQYVKVNVFGCDLGDACAPDSEVDATILNMRTTQNRFTTK